MRSRCVCVVAVLTVALVVGACNDDDNDERTPAADATQTERVDAQRHAAEEPSLAKPLFARCGTDHFAPPISQRRGNGWRVRYDLRPGAQARTAPAETTFVTLFERPPSLPRGKLEGARERTIGGRKTSFVNRSAQRAYVVQWKTRRARYTAVVDGRSTLVLERVVACMP